VPGVESAYETAATIGREGIPAAAIDGTTPIAMRRAILSRFRRGEIRALANCSVFTEGFDEPSISCVVLARPTLSRALYVQQAGRGLRPHPGKADCLLLDLVGSTSRHQLVSAASLAGLAADDVRDGERLIDAVGRKRRLIERAAQAQEADVALQARTVELFRQRPVHWVQSGTRYTVATGHSQVTLRPDDPSGARGGDRWTAIERLHDGTTRVLVGGVSLPYAQGTAEDYVRRVGVSVLVDPHAAWRRSHLPPSDKQLAVLRRNRITVPPTLTRGEASDLIAQVFARRAS
jgi:hypothetical protein